MDLARYADLFRTESREHLSAMTVQLLALEREPTATEPVAALFRSVHTIKGMAAAMGYEVTETLSHELESVLEQLRRSSLHVTPRALEAMLRAADVLEIAVERAASSEPAPDPGGVVAELRALTDAAPDADATSLSVTAELPAAPELLHSGGTRQLRIDASRLDALMDLAGELGIMGGRLASHAAASGDPTLELLSRDMARLITALRDEVLECRLVPVGQILGRFPRLVREAARAAGKDVDLVLDGERIEIDRSMLDEIGEPVMHLLRNAVDHGIESPDERRSAGKPPSGCVRVSARRERGTVVIEVTDDGRGVNRERVMERARAMGLLDESTAALDDVSLWSMLARPGFSTSESVTGLSGRGVGVDAVVARVRSIGGSAEMHTTPGAGTSVRLRVPLTRAIVRALLARVGDESYAIPLSQVRSTCTFDPRAVQGDGDHRRIIVREELLPLIDLRDVLQLPGASEGAEMVVVESGMRRAAMIVDSLVGQEDVVVKTFGNVRGSAALFSGATVLGDGTAALILDVGGLL